MRRDEVTKMNDFWEVHRGTAARPDSKSGAPSGDKVARDVEMFGVLPPPAMEAVPFLKR